MKKHGLRRTYVVQYEAKPEGDEPAGVQPEASVAGLNTHDMPTFAGFGQGRDIDARVEQGLLGESTATEERNKRRKIRDRLTLFLEARGLLQDGSGNVRTILGGLLRFLAASSAEIVLVNLEDLWLEAGAARSEGDEATADVSAARREVDGNAT